MYLQEGKIASVQTVVQNQGASHIELREPVEYAANSWLVGLCSIGYVGQGAWHAALCCANRPVWQA
jgi:hypothetical protein